MQCGIPGGSDLSRVDLKRVDLKVDKGAARRPAVNWIYSRASAEEFN